MCVLVVEREMDTERLGGEEEDGTHSWTWRKGSSLSAMANVAVGSLPAVRELVGEVRSDNVVD